VKYAIVIPDGAADRPTALLQGRTPLEVARIPNMDRIAASGRLGMARFAPEDLEPGSDVCILSLIGYDPRRCYTGRAPLEAVARGIELAPRDWAFRMNFVTVSDGEMADHSAGHITTKEAAVLVEALRQELASPEVRFHAGVGYRHLVVIQGEDFRVRTTPPHDILGRRVARHLPRGRGSKRLRALMDAAAGILASHPINKVRVDLGERPATAIWLWGQGQKPYLEPFAARWGLHGAAITAVDLVRGIARLIGWDVINVAGATGYYDTDYAAKGRAAVEALADHDLVLVHVEAPDEAGHNGEVLEKVRALENIDRLIVGPLLEALEAGGEFRILVAPDHLTPVDLRTHDGGPVPFAMVGSGLEAVRQGGVMTEAAASKAGLLIEPGHGLMEYFLKR
jgi:2,3-bisphosphoglycerate-independent phosphoglycerate mutase